VARTGGVPGRGWRPGQRWSARVPVVAAGLLLTGRALVAAVGTPVAQARTLRSLGHGPVDPVAPLLAALALLAEALIGYVLVMLVLRSLGALPGSVGRLASRAALLASPVLVRRLLDLLVGGTLLAQATLATMPEPPSGPRTGTVHMAQTAPRALSGAFDRAASRSGPPVAGTEPVAARPSPRRSAAPLPPWLGGGPSRPAPGYTVEAGDTLWGIAAARLAPAERSPASVHRYWQEIYQANRAVVGADPNLIRPGMRLDVPPLHLDRR
jgi:resuscitation-promoting factor RpfA